MSGAAAIGVQSMQSNPWLVWCDGSPTFEGRTLALVEEFLSLRSLKRDRNQN